MSGYVEGLLIVFAINTVLAYAVFLPIAAGQLNLGIAGFMAVGAYGSAWLSGDLMLPPQIAIIGGSLLALLVGLIVAVPVLRTRGIYLALATFALGHVIQGLFLNLTAMGGAAGYPVLAYIELDTILTFAIVVVLLVFWLFSTRFGIVLSAVKADEAVTDLFGVNVRLAQLVAFVLGAAIAGIAGGIYAHYYSYITPQYFNVLLSIFVVLYVILGGTGSVFGPLLGAAVFTILPELLRASSEWRYALFALFIIALMIVRPQGLLGSGGLPGLTGLVARLKQLGPNRQRAPRLSEPKEGGAE